MPAKDNTVEGQMHNLVEQWEACQDARAIFLGCYRLMTLNMLKALQEGEFQDSLWVDQLLHHFANYYFKALQAYEDGDPATPKAWQVAFEATRQPHLSAIQHLLLGVNAHINYDLVLAEVDLLEAEWHLLPDVARQQRRADHDHVNEIIGRTIDSVQDTILERREAWLDVLDQLLGPLDEWLTSRLISAWRDDVWDEAVRFLATNDVQQRDQLRALREQQVLQLAQKILRFS